MKRVLVTLLALLVIVALGATAGRVKDDTWWWGDGARLGILFPFFTTHYVEIPESAPSFFRLGWWEPVYPGWQNDMREYFGKKIIVGAKSIYAKLWIDGMKVNLDHNRLWMSYAELGPDPMIPFEVPADTDCLCLEWYIQFEPGYFEPGVYEVSWEIAHRNPNHIFWLLGPGMPITGTTILTVLPD